MKKNPSTAPNSPPHPNLMLFSSLSGSFSNDFNMPLFSIGSYVSYLFQANLVITDLPGGIYLLCKISRPPGFFLLQLVPYSCKPVIKTRK